MNEVCTCWSINSHTSPLNCYCVKGNAANQHISGNDGSNDTGGGSCVLVVTQSASNAQQIVSSSRPSARQDHHPQSVPLSSGYAFTSDRKSCTSERTCDDNFHTSTPLGRSLITGACVVRLSVNLTPVARSSP